MTASHDYEKTFLEKRACSMCGSSDNLTVYYNESLQGETWSCRTPGCKNIRTDYDLLKNKPMHIQREGLQTIALKKRGISKATCERYGVKVDLERGEYVYPYYDTSGRLVASKYRPLAEKTFYWEGDAKAATFFGFNTSKAKKSLLITEGEFDALSAAQMTTISTVVSVPNGAQSASSFIKKHLQWVESFEKVYICFDNDEPGILATEEVMNLIRIGKAYNVKLRRKDANEYLLADEAQQFKDDVFAAVAKSYDGIVDEDTVGKWIVEQLSGISSVYESVGNTGIKSLDEKFHLRKGELTTVFSDPSVGKSSLLRWMVSNLLLQDIKVLVIAMEEVPREWATKTAGMCLGEKVIDVDRKPDEVIKKLSEFVKRRLRISTYSGTISVADISDVVEYGVRQYDSQVVVLDNITAATADDPNTCTIISQMISKLNFLAKTLSVPIIVVSHTRRDKDVKAGDAPGMSNAYGSGSIERFSHNIISLGRDVKNDSDTTKIRICKQRATGVVGEILVNYDKPSATFYEKQQSENDGRGERFGRTVRLNRREASPSEKPETNTSSIEVESIHDNVHLDVQPRLFDKWDESECLHRSEGIPTPRVANQDESSDLRAEMLSQIPTRKPSGSCQPTDWSKFSQVATIPRVRFRAVAREQRNTDDTE